MNVCTHKSTLLVLLEDLRKKCVYILHTDTHTESYFISAAGGSQRKACVYVVHKHTHTSPSSLEDLRKSCVHFCVLSEAGKGKQPPQL